MTLKVDLTPDLVRFAEAEVASGRFASVDDVVMEALRLLQERDSTREVAIERLKRAWRAGEAAGDFAEFDLDAVKRAGRERLRSATD